MTKTKTKNKRPTHCSICTQRLRFTHDDGHHLEVSPLDSKLCLGCWMASTQMEMFLLRAFSMEGRSPWTLEVYDLLKEVLANFIDRKYAPGKPRYGEPR